MALRSNTTASVSFVPWLARAIVFSRMAGPVNVSFKTLQDSNGLLPSFLDFSSLQPWQVYEGAMMRNRRNPHPRYDINQQVSLVFGHDSCRVFCELKDMSMTGARLASVPLKSFPDSFKIVIDSEDVALNCRLCWVNATEIGVEFIGQPEHNVRFFGPVCRY